MNDYCGLSSLVRATAKLRRQTEKGTCGTRIRSEPHPDVTRSTRTDMTFVHLRSTKSREHMSRATTPGLTARRVSPRVTHSFPPALAAMKKGRGRDEGKRVDVDALARETERENESHRPCETCPSRLNVVNTKVQLRHLIIGHIIFIHERRTAAETARAGRAGREGSHQSPVGWIARGVDGEDRRGPGETAFDRWSAA